METETTKAVKQTRNHPAKDADLSTLGMKTSAKWKTHPEFSLRWISADEHTANANAFAATLSERNFTGSGRKEITGKLKALDTSINEATTAIKSYLVYKFEKRNASAYYPQFGIQRQGRYYMLPFDRDKRLAALQIIQEAIAMHGFTNEKYGAAYWLETYNNYQTLLQQASNIDGTVSNKVGQKNTLRKTLVKTHLALIHLLQANYPDTYKSVMREWGFQKEKY